VVFLDAFISLYDTVVMDRKILKENGVLARILYLLEKRAFEAATVVIVDTPENASYYSKLFGTPSDKFHAMPLCIPPLTVEIEKPKEHTSRRVRCIFVGTLVPLQGIRTIVDAVNFLEGDSEIEFVCIGDGQDAEHLDGYLSKTSNPRLTWHRGHYSTDFIVQQIRNADICLGIFGDGPKAQRVTWHWECRSSQPRQIRPIEFWRNAKVLKSKGRSSSCRQETRSRWQMRSHG
jgi:glycosyltransferase involved in cell wall biosynthesis